MQARHLPHGAVRVDDGVAVTLINVSAARRARALQLALFDSRHDNGYTK